MIIMAIRWALENEESILGFLIEVYGYDRIN